MSVGYVVHLNYKNPYISPFDEFQRHKLHPEIAQYLNGGKRIAYGARAITEGGLQSVPKLAFPGGALIGCAAGFVNVPRIKGSHNAMKTGMMAAEAAFAAIRAGRQRDTLIDYEEAYRDSRVYKDLSACATPSRCSPNSEPFGAASPACSICGRRPCLAAFHSSAR